MPWIRAGSPPPVSTSSSASRSTTNACTHPNVLLTPHTAFYSVEGYAELRTKTAEEIRRILLGQPPRNPVNVVAGRA